MAQVEVLDVRVGNPDANLLVGFHLDAPSPGDQIDHYALDLRGWVVGRASAVKRVEVLMGGQVVRDCGVWIERPDLARLLGKALTAKRGPFLKRWAGWLWPRKSANGTGNDPGRSGFHVVVSTLGLPPVFDLDLAAVLEDGSRISLARLRGRHAPVRLTYQPRRQPIVLSHLGRSGSTWLARLMAEHPGIVVHRRYPFESFAALHALRLLQVVTTPSGPVQQPTIAELTKGLKQVAGLPLHCEAEDPHLHGWLRRDYVERFANFCVSTIDALYDEVAQNQGKSRAGFFCEKMFFYPLAATLCAELYPGGRQVFLVRDFRDVVCSRVAFLHRGEPHSTARFGELIRHVGRTSQELLAIWRHHLTRAHLVHYEDLVLRPEETLEQLFAYLGLEGDRATVEGVLARAAQDPMGLPQHLTSSDPIQSIGRWKQDLPPALRELWQEQLGEPLQAFGYSTAA